MHVVAYFSVTDQAWWWRIVHWTGTEVARSSAEDASMAAALEAGAAHRQRLTARRPTVLRRPALHVRRRGVRPRDAAS
jgi:hypothetical protein